MPTEVNEIEAVLHDYLHGIRDSNPERVAATFHDDARLTGVFGGEFRSLDQVGPTIAHYMRSTPPTLEQSPDYEFEILSIQHRGSLACAAVEERHLEGKNHITYFILHKVNGRWQFLHKGTAVIE